MKTRQIMTVSEKARQQIANLTSGTNDGKKLRIGLQKGGCAGVSYKIELIDVPLESDEPVRGDGYELYLESQALLFLLGTEMDYEESDLSSGFIFHNPNQVSACGCGESVALQAVPAETLHQVLMQKSQTNL